MAVIASFQSFALISWCHRNVRAITLFASGFVSPSPRCNTTFFDLVLGPASICNVGCRIYFGTLGNASITVS